MAVQLRGFEMGDYEDVIALWHAAGIHVGSSDSRKGLERKLQRDPELFLVAHALPVEQ